MIDFYFDSYNVVIVLPFYRFYHFSLFVDQVVDIVLFIGSYANVFYLHTEKKKLSIEVVHFFFY